MGFRKYRNQGAATRGGFTVLWAICLAAGACSASETMPSGSAGSSSGGSGGSGGMPADDLIAKYDENGDGVLSLDEAPPEIQKEFADLDLNGDGVLSEKELEKAGQPIDTGGSGGGASGAGGDGPVSVQFGEECVGLTQRAENRLAPVDIIMTIDTSGSMTFEAMEVQNNMNDFANIIVNAGIDFRLVLISDVGPPDPLFPPVFPPPPDWPKQGVCLPAPLGNGTCPDDTNLPVYLHLLYAVASTNSLQLMIQYFPEYHSHLRVRSLKYFSVITDDNSALPAADFAAKVPTFDPGPPDLFEYWKFFGVFCTGTCPVLGACANTGTVYQELVNMTGTMAGDLCQGQSDFGTVFFQLAESIVQEVTVDCSWLIPPPPEGEVLNPKEVNVLYTKAAGGDAEPIYHVPDPAKCGDNDGWYYDDPDNPTTIIACPATCEFFEQDQGQVDILFGCETVTLIE